MFGGKRGRRRWCGGGVMVVVVVGMKEEMEERKMVELVVEMEGRVKKMAGQGGGHGSGGCCHLLAGNGEGKKNERERERKVGIYKRRGFDYYNLAIPKMSCVSLKKRAASSHNKSLRLGNQARCGDKIRVQEKNARFAFDRKDKKAWFRIDLAGQALNAVWRASHIKC